MSVVLTLIDIWQSEWEKHGDRGRVTDASNLHELFGQEQSSTALACNASFLHR